MSKSRKIHTRTAGQLTRRMPRRDPYQKVLIVCEGEKTEPIYFNEIINYYKINTANVKVDGSCGSSPKNVSEYAFKLYQDSLETDNPYDRVFCVFDKDSHTTFYSAVKFIADKQQVIKKTHLEKKKSDVQYMIPTYKEFCSITSVPCFEYWLLLHNGLSTKPYNRVKGKSPCECVIKDIKSSGLIPRYSKAYKGVFNELIGKVEDAIKNSQAAKKSAKNSGTDNPTTQIDELVRYLQNIKK